MRALFVKGDKKPNGSNNAAIFDNHLRFVMWMSLFCSEILYLKLSSLAFHHNPSVFTIGKNVSSFSFRLQAWSSAGIISMTCFEFDAHFQACIPAELSNSDRFLYRLIPASTVSTESILSSI